jgi:DNA-binding XRE family transcriptional regulator
MQQSAASNMPSPSWGNKQWLGAERPPGHFAFWGEIQMAKRNEDSEEIAAREARAREWRQFRAGNSLTRARLAGILNCHIGTVQNIEDATVTHPQRRVLDAFTKLKARYDIEHARTRAWTGGLDGMTNQQQDTDVIGRRKGWAKAFTEFRQRNLYTQVQLAEILHISRRDVQLIEAGAVSARYKTLREFNALKARHDRGEKEAA